MVGVLASWIYGIFGIAFLVGTLVWVVQSIKSAQYHETDEERIIRVGTEFWVNEWGTGSKEEIEELKRILKQFEERHK
ncbi:MAG: hypothetical protein NC305_12095 [Lachnospiraceae bacterium]|nr:hypothetical protein [Muribaculaceae bacterium]MCM1411273.1 hypothetical protein [Lachnospiraceae bacterium]